MRSFHPIDLRNFSFKISVKKSRSSAAADRPACRQAQRKKEITLAKPQSRKGLLWRTRTYFTLIKEKRPADFLFFNGFISVFFLLIRGGKRRKGWISIPDSKEIVNTQKLYLLGNGWESKECNSPLLRGLGGFFERDSS